MGYVRSVYIGHNWAFCDDDSNYCVCIQRQTNQRELIGNAMVGMVVFTPQPLTNSSARKSYLRCCKQ